MAAISRVRAWAMVSTPFTDDLAGVDEVSLARLVTHQKHQGVDGFIVLGVIGEPDALTCEEKAQVIGTVVRAAGDVPVLASAMSLDAGERECDLVVFAGFGDALAAVMIPVTSEDPRELAIAVDHAARVSGSPVVIQDYPAATGVHIAITDLVDVVRRDARVVAVKSEAAPTFTRISALRDARPELQVMAGSGGIGLVEDMLAGAQAVTCQTTPADTVCRAAELVRDGQIAEARAQLGRIAALVNYEVQQRSSIAIRKEHWRRQGVIAHAGVRGNRMRYCPLMSRISDSLGYPDQGDGR